MRRVFRRLRWIGPSAAFVLAAIGCGSHSANPREPLPTTSTAIPPELGAGLGQTPRGFPILVETTAGLPPGLALAIAYNANADDAVARYGECLSRLSACYAKNHGVIGDCFDDTGDGPALIQPCADDTGGKGCCAPACISQYRELLGREGEDKAVTDSFFLGDCLVGFADELPPRVKL